MSVLDRRIAATRLVGKLLATREGRHYLVSNGYKSGQAIVTAEYDELIKDVVPRIHSHTPPVTVALIKGDELCMFAVEPKGEKESSSASPNSTIGMLYEASCQTTQGSSFHVTDWDRSATAVSMPSVKELLAH